MQVINTIIDVFSEKPNYLFEISGIDVDRYIDDMDSSNYLLTVDETHKFIKDLPKLFVLSNHLEDARQFGKYIGSFNEGYMYLYILTEEDIELCDEKCPFDSVRENALLTIEVDADGDVINLYCDSTEKASTIIQSMKGKTFC